MGIKKGNSGEIRKYGSPSPIKGDQSKLRLYSYIYLVANLLQNTTKFYLK